MTCGYPSLVRYLSVAGGEGTRRGLQIPAVKLSHGFNKLGDAGNVPEPLEHFPTQGGSAGA